MVKVRAFDVPPPGTGLKIVTKAVPVDATSAAEISAVTERELTNVVVRSDPFHRITDAGLNPAPVAVNVKPGPPTVAELGLMLDKAGTGLLTVKVCGLDVPPPGAGLKTVTATVPVDAMSEAVMAAVKVEPVTNVVERSAPFQRTTDPEINPDPATVNVKPFAPEVAIFGMRFAMVGTGLFPTTVKVCVLDVPPPGAGLKTVTAMVAVEAMSAAVMEAVKVDELT
jgi:hypothetical protein